MIDKPPILVNESDVDEIDRTGGEHFGACYKPLTPGMRPRGGSLGVNRMRVAPGRAAVPFHTHQLEDEAFYVLEGRGMLRYGDEVYPLRPGDCVSCAAGTGVAHQIANPFDEDLVYLAIGTFSRHEVATYPDNGKVLVRSLDLIGFMQSAKYMDGEPDPPRFLELAKKLEG